MQPFVTFQGVAAPLERANVDTDAIVPKQFLRSIRRTGLGRVMFLDWRFLEGDPDRPNPGFVLNHPEYQSAGILVTGENFGCGSSREHAAWALMDYGIRCVIGVSFADIFYNNCLKNGLLPAVVTPSAHAELITAIKARPSAALQVNLPSQRITHPDGILCGFEIAQAAKQSLLIGQDEIDRTLEREAVIRDFEAHSAAKISWLV